jgi:hypothetical protein
MGIVIAIAIGSRERPTANPNCDPIPNVDAFGTIESISAEITFIFFTKKP